MKLRQGCFLVYHIEWLLAFVTFASDVDCEGIVIVSKELLMFVDMSEILFHWLSVGNF